MSRLAPLLAALVLALGAAPARAQVGPVSPFQAPPTTTDAPPPTSSSTADDDGLERWQEILIFLGGVGLIIGIAVAILRDARRRAPVDDEEAFYREELAENPQKARRKAQARKRGKAQRRARRHNR